LCPDGCPISSISIFPGLSISDSRLSQTLNSRVLGLGGLSCFYASIKERR
jgi:hypothetical protein